MFHFKRFSIEDNKSAMKIGTDAVLLGAWTPCNNETRILDIGTGSGILALMMAQRIHTIPVDAVEIDRDAATLAIQNIKLSPWTDRICIFNTTIQQFSLLKREKYSLIICNPPFFTDSLKAPGKARSIARHNDTLPVAELLSITSKLLLEKGKAAFIIPYSAFGKWKSEAASQLLFPTLTTLVKSSASHQPHRMMVLFTKNAKSAICENEICIYNSQKKYSDEYCELTKEFYLKF